ncbi:hypothetical protein SDJN02_08544, partial [Cucurbita argyrosperma subsp. argyrosperma]
MHLKQQASLKKLDELMISTKRLQVGCTFPKAQLDATVWCLLLTPWLIKLLWQPQMVHLNAPMQLNPPLWLQTTQPGLLAFEMEQQAIAERSSRFCRSVAENVPEFVFDNFKGNVVLLQKLQLSGRHCSDLFISSKSFSASSAKPRSDYGRISNVIKLNPTTNHLISKIFDKLKLPTVPQRLHSHIVEDSLHRKQILGLDPIEEQMSFLPWLQAIENQKGIFFSGWMWDFLKSRHESTFRGFTGVELVGKGFKVSAFGVI